MNMTLHIKRRWSSKVATQGRGTGWHNRFPGSLISGAAMTDWKKELRRTTLILRCLTAAAIVGSIIAIAYGVWFWRQCDGEIVRGLFGLVCIK
jgi:hypothetical protein